MIYRNKTTKNGDCEMTTTIRFTFLTIIILLVFASGSLSQQKAKIPQEKDILDYLIGTWDMKGEVKGKPVTYTFETTRVLHDKLVLMHMKDIAEPSPYEADVYIGLDTARSCYVTFWLDNFGVDSNMAVLGYGKRHGDTLIIMFNFPGEPFRDTFSYDRANDTWRFLLEDGTIEGKWTTFADYTLVRKTK
jgi:hypothetical protein